MTRAARLMIWRYTILTRCMESTIAHGWDRLTEALLMRRYRVDDRAYSTLTAHDYHIYRRYRREIGSR
jgi:hypothetical protein